MLVTPAELTPHELKHLSDIDDQEGLRFRLPFLHLYRSAHIGGGAADPAVVIKEAISKALVYYYPFAGRLHETEDRKLVVDCTGEGVLFVEADADVRLDQLLVDLTQSPSPFIEELFPRVDKESDFGILNSPLLLFQVTRLACGGLVFSQLLTHSMADSPGYAQFLQAVGELARGATQPALQPVWQRELLSAGGTPQVTFAHPQYHEHHDDHTKGAANRPRRGYDIPGHLIHRSFFFGYKEMEAIRRHLPPHLREQPEFDILTAVLWRCRTVALQIDPKDEVRVLCLIDFRRRLSPPLPNGYYGAAYAFSPATTKAGDLGQQPLEHAVKLVSEANAAITNDYVCSLVEHIVAKGRAHVGVTRSYIVIDLSGKGFDQVDFGWGLPLFGGPPTGDDRASFYVPFTNNNGEHGLLVSLCLPELAMDRFVVEMDKLLKGSDAS